MSVFDFLTTIRAKLEADGFVVSDSIQDKTNYTSGPSLVFIGPPNAELTEDYAQCVHHNVTFDLTVLAYDYNGKSNAENMSDAIDNIILSLYNLEDSANGFQNLTTGNYETNINYTDNDVAMSGAVFPYTYLYQQKIPS